MERKFRAHEKERGFTLIEVVVVIAIIALTSAIVIVSLSNARVNQDLNRASQTMATNIRLANNYALTGRTGDINQKVCEYRVIFNSNFSYQIATISRDGSGNCTSPQILNVYPMEGGVRILSPTNRFVSFTPPRGDTNLGGPLTVTLMKNSKNVLVCISRTGRVEEHPAGTPCT